ncbi:nucleotide-binding protein [endosymbiont of unidentified scaly snail isolate Monju]|uniref:nucleotide-binding protein n=1 Tax=endosymbiont of unidentified scaly snail isolate Monju TaxID=1248727 RepID=UPI0003892610|nr:AAA family ATPase [endosymbiont of unidentified scaly snail isolate Monju]BAN68809.1 chromosome partitioning protein [endosymbiont of unidentified scaly snail isolate Monju]
MITMIGSLKGGSGKSTVTFNLAIWLKLADSEVAVVDADPQATLSDVLMVRAEEDYHPTAPRLKADVLKSPEALGEYEQVLIDVGTASMDNLKQAIAVADRILVPVPPSQADIWSTQRFLRFVAANAGDRDIEVLGFINRADTHHAIRESDEAAAALISLPGIRYLKPRLAQRTVYRRSFSEGLAVFEQQPRGKGAAEWNALAAALYPDLLG